MSLTSDSIPNLIQGISQQPQSLRSVSQLEAQENCYSSPVEGLIHRPPTEHIAKVSDTPLNDAFMHTINRSADQRFKLVLSSGALRVFDLLGDEKTINFIDEDLLILDNAGGVLNGSTFILAAAPGESNVDITVAGITTATVKVQGSTDNAAWTDLATTTVNGTLNNISFGTYIYIRAIVSAWTSGSIDVTITYKNARYLNTATPKLSLRALTVADYTFLVNTEKVPAMRTDLSPVRDAEGLVQVKKGEYGSEYQIKINGTVRATYTTSSTNVTTLSTTHICTELFNDLVAWAGANFAFARNGSTIWIKNTLEDFTLQTADSQGGTSLIGFKDKTASFTSLPAEAPEGFVIAIDADTTTDQGAYYVEAIVNQETETFGPVTWQESLVAGIPYLMDERLLPYSLIHNVDDTFDFVATSWAERLCGDEDTNADPSFIGKGINDVFFYKNRLSFLADENFILSEVGEYFNFFRSTVTQVKDSDPVDSRANNTTVSILKRAVPYNKSLILFADQTQFIIPSDTAMTPKTVRCDVVGNYASLLTVAPANAGQAIYFMFNRESYAGMSELEVSQTNPDKYDADEVSSHVPSYIPAGVFSLEVSTLAHVSTILTTGDPSSCYVYKTEHAKEKKVQAAWFRWNYNDYTDSDVLILSADFIESTLYLLVQRNGEVFLEKMQLIPKRVDPFHTYATFLDRRVSDLELTVTPTYDVGTNTTLLTLPYDITSDEMCVVTRSVADNAPYDDPGRQLQIVTSAIGQPTITVRGDYSNNPLWIGQRFLCEAELSTIYVRKQSLNGGIIIDAASKLQLLRGTVVYSDSGPFTVSVTPEGRVQSDSIFTGRVVGDINNVLGQVALRSGRFSFGILSNNERVRIVFHSNSFLPFHLTSFDWEGNYTKRSQGR